MDMWDFKKWRRVLRLSQVDAAEKLGVSRGAIQSWESERRRIPLAVVLACGELIQQSKRHPKFGPVLLFYSNEPLSPDRDCPSSVLRLVRESHVTNEAALQRICRLGSAPDFVSSFIVDAEGNMIWPSNELVNEGEKRRRIEENM